MCLHCGNKPRLYGFKFCKSCRNNDQRLRRMGKRLTIIHNHTSGLNFVKYDAYETYELVTVLKAGTKWIPWLYERR